MSRLGFRGISKFSGQIDADGGTVSTVTESGVEYRTHTFATPGSSTFTINYLNKSPVTVECLLVGAGGSGGTGDNEAQGGGGGGAGGVYEGSLKMRSTGGSVVLVGLGGPRRAQSSTNFDGFQGGGTFFYGLNIPGGGGGANAGGGVNLSTIDGASGGGGSSRNTGPSGRGDNVPGFGNIGGYAVGYVRTNSTDYFYAYGGGGGGAGGPGGSFISSSNTLPDAYAHGGPGVSSLISGQNRTYSVGGNGGWSIFGPQAFDASGIGYGGMGARGANEAPGTASQNKPPGGAGGNGIAIIRYPDSRIGNWTISSVSSFGAGSIVLNISTTGFDFSSLEPFANYIVIINNRSYIGSFSSTEVVANSSYTLTITGSFPSPSSGQRVQIRRPGGIRKYSNAVII
jgi:hypothetical protein